MKVKSNDIKAKIEPEKSLRNLVKDEEQKERKSFEEAMEKIWNPEI